MAFDLLDAGTYKGVIVSWGLDILPSGTEYLETNVLFTARENEATGELEPLPEAARRSMKYWINSPENEDRTLANLRYLGFESDDLFDADPSSDNAFDFKGVEAFYNLSHGTNNRGEIQENIFLSRRRKPMDDAKRAALQGKRASFAEKAKARKQRLAESARV